MNDRTIAYDIIDTEELGPETWISTVRLPTDPGFRALDSVFFGESRSDYETMVFPADSFLDYDVERYETEEQALEGHKRMVEKWRNR